MRGWTIVRHQNGKIPGLIRGRGFFCTSAKPADVHWPSARDGGSAGFAAAKTGHGDSDHP